MAVNMSQNWLCKLAQRENQFWRALSRPAEREALYGLKID